MAKLENKYIKTKLKAKFGEFEVYNAIDKEIYTRLSKMIADNSKQINLEDGKTDIEINTIRIMREMLISLTNIENEEYWNNINDIDLEKMLDLADGDFKEVVNSLLDVMIEIGKDLRTQSLRQLDILQDKLNEMVESVKFDMNVDKTLAKFGLNREKIVKLQQGDKTSIDEFQKNLIENMNKPKRGRPKTKK